MRFVLGHYQEFHYNMDALKSLYFERKNVKDDKFDSDWRPLLKKILESREPLIQSYFNSVSFSFLAMCCCCRRQYWERHVDDGGWYWFKRQKELKEKIALAQEKFNGEVDLKNIIKTLRLNKFQTKMKINKRQRRSVSYFRRYTVDEVSVKKEEARKQERKALRETTTHQQRDEIEKEALETEKQWVI